MGRIGFRMIDQLIARVMDELPHIQVDSIEGLLEQDFEARRITSAYMNS